MPKRGNIISTIACAAIFIILEVAALGILKRNGEFQSIWVANVIRNFNANVWGGTENIRNYFSLKQENERLAAENFALTQKIREYQLEDNNFVPGSVSEWTSAGNFRFLNAAIVKSSSNSQHNFYLIGKGSNDGVKEGDGIITERGVIGIVHAVSPKYSYVMSFKNAAMLVSARLGLESGVGSLSWKGYGNDAILKEVPLHTKFEKGDTVFTSGFSSIFPPDIPLGTAGQSKIINGATHEIQVSLFEDFQSLRYVTVVSNLDNREINELSKE